MRLVEKHQIRRNHNLYKLCDKLCFKSKNLYNAALYVYRQSFIDKNRKNLTWMEINKLFNYNSSQMKQIRLGLEKGLDVPLYAKPEIDDYKMEDKRLELERQIKS